MNAAMTLARAQPNTPSVCDLFTLSRVLKVIDGVVRLVAVDVVDGHSGRPRSDKSLCYKAVHAHRPLTRETNSHVSEGVEMYLPQSAWDSGFRRQSTNSSKVAYLKDELAGDRPPLLSLKVDHFWKWVAELAMPSKAPRVHRTVCARSSAAIAAWRRACIRNMRTNLHQNVRRAVFHPTQIVRIAPAAGMSLMVAAIDRAFNGSLGLHLEPPISGVTGRAVDAAPSLYFTPNRTGFLSRGRS